MRTFVSRGNLVWAAVLAAPVTLAATGRLMYGDRSLTLHLPILFLCMMYIAGAITAWGSHAGMKGVLTDRRTLVLGACIAAALALLALPVHLLWIDPLFRAIMPARVHEMVFPSTFGGRVSLVLWAAGVQTMFLSAAPLAVAVRLIRRRIPAIAVCVLVRAYLAYRIANGMEIGDGRTLFIALAMANSAITCILFARFGLAPACVYNACLELHVFFAPPLATDFRGVAGT